MYKYLRKSEIRAIHTQYKISNKRQTLHVFSERKCSFTDTSAMATFWLANLMRGKKYVYTQG